MVQIGKRWLVAGAALCMSLLMLLSMTSESHAEVINASHGYYSEYWSGACEPVEVACNTKCINWILSEAQKDTYTNGYWDGTITGGVPYDVCHCYATKKSTGELVHFTDSGPTVLACGFFCPDSTWILTGTTCTRPDCSPNSIRLDDGTCSAECLIPDWHPNSNGQCVPPEKNTGRPDPETCTGNPLHAGTGNKYQPDTDYTSASGLTLNRHYNSQTTTAGPFGSNWSILPGLTVNGTTLTASRPDGQQLPYTLSNGLWLPDADVNLTLTATETGYLLTTPDGDQEAYDPAGLLQSVTDRTGRVLSYLYTDGHLTRITDDFGHSLSFGYDGDRVSTLTDPAGQLITYTYDSAGNLHTVTYPDLTPADPTDNPTRTYHYDDPTYPHALTGITDEKNIRYATWTYDPEGRAYISEHANGADRVQLAYNEDGTTTVTDPLNTPRTHGFATVLGVVKGTGVSQPAGSGCAAASSAITHDANGNVSTRDDFNGHRTRYWHDLTRNLETTRTEGLGLDNGSETVLPETRTLTTLWHPTWRLPTEIKTYEGSADSSGQPQGTPLKTETFTYDATTGNVLTHTVTDPVRLESRTTTTTWTTLGRIKTVDGPRSDVADLTTYDYYPDDDPDLARRGQLWKITNALNHVTEILAYDLHGHPTQFKDPNGLLTTLTYTPRGWLDTRTLSGPSGTRLTDYTYDDVGQLTRIDLPDGSWIEYDYDDAHRLTDITNARGDHLHYDLDPAGNILTETTTNAAGTQTRKLTRDYDALGRLWKDIRRINGQDAVTEYGHDAQGNPTTRTDPLSHTTLTPHDALDRLAQTEDALQGHTDLTHNPLDDLTRHSDALGLPTTYITDAFGQVRRETSPDRGTTTTTYDAAGNLKTRTDARNITLTLTYDALNRLRSIDRPSGTDTTYTYDQGPNGLGRLTGMTDESGSTTWTYNEFGEVTNKTQTHSTTPGLTRSVGYTYQNGRLSRLTYPSGAYVDYTWSQGRISALSLNGAPLLSNLQYQPYGPAQSWTWGNGQAYSRSYDGETGWPLSYPLGSDTRTLKYDSAGRITTYDYPGTSLDQGYGYDALDRLTSQTTKQGTTQWTLDGNGNRQNHKSGPTTYPYTRISGSNRLESIAGPVAKTYQYDLAGNITHDGTYGYTYDDAGRLAKLTYTTQNTTYLYNGEGLRVHKAGRGASNGPLRYVYDAPGKLLGEYDKNGALLQETVWLDDQPVAVLMPSGTYYVHADHLNAPRVMLDSANRIVWKWDGDAFGVGAANTDPDKDGKSVSYNLRLPGQYYDSESGLHYNTFRDYDPRSGRYVQVDPIGIEGGANPYNYANQNPLIFIDPDGLSGVLTLPRPLFGPRPTPMSAERLDPTFPFTSAEPIPGGPNDPYSEYCRSLESRLKNTRKEIYDKRYPDLASNPRNLPQRIGPGEKLSETVRGHEKLLNRRLRELRKLEDEYVNNCGC